MLTYVSEHHEKQTKSTVLDLQHIPRSHSANIDRAFSVQGPKLWNSLPADIRNSTSINRFKRELKRYLLYNNYDALKSTLALPVWHCRRTLKDSLVQNYLFVWGSCFLRWFIGRGGGLVNNKNIVHSKSRFP